jgi:uncharacterized protein (TIGR00251 family)
LRITVDVKASSREEGVEEVGSGVYVVRVRAPRRKGKANAAVLQLLRKHFGQPARILSGHTSNRKIIEIDGRGEF